MVKMSAMLAFMHAQSMLILVANPYGMLVVTKLTSCQTTLLGGIYW